MPVGHESNRGYLSICPTTGAYYAESIPAKWLLSGNGKQRVACEANPDMKVSDAIVFACQQLGVPVEEASQHALQLVGRAEFADVNTAASLRQCGFLFGQSPLMGVAAAQADRASTLNMPTVEDQAKHQPVLMHARLVAYKDLPRPFLRFAPDDSEETDPRSKFVRVRSVVKLPLNQKVVSMLTETINTHMAKLLNDVNVSTVQQLEQSIKSLCALVAKAETGVIRASLMQLRAASKTQPPQIAAVKQAVEAIKAAQGELLQLYSRATNQPLSGSQTDFNANARLTYVSDVSDMLLVRVASLHRIPQTWYQRHELYRVQVSIYTGGVPLCATQSTEESRTGRHHAAWFETVYFHDRQLEINLPLCKIPKEARLIFQVFASTEMKASSWESMGWVALRLYDHQGRLNSGSHLLGLWMEPQPRPTGTCINNLYNESSAAVVVEIDPRDRPILYSARPPACDEPVRLSDIPSAEDASLPESYEEPVLAVHTAMVAFEGDPSLGQLSFAAGEQIEVVAKDGHEAWRGRRVADRTRIGTFPPEYMDLQDKPEPKQRISSRIETSEAETGVTMTKLRCQAVYSYSSDYEDDELLLEKGTEIVVTKQAADGWWFGTTEMQPKGGWFPSNHCKVVEDLSQTATETTTTATIQGEVFVALHDYQPTYEDELKLTQGKNVLVLQQPDGGWWQGQVDDNTGWFPANYVKSQDKTEALAGSTAVLRSDTETVGFEESLASQGDQYIAMHTFEATHTDELSFRAGEMITVISKPEEGGWFEGTKEDGSQGWFPEAYVREAVKHPTAAATGMKANAVAFRATTGTGMSKEGINTYLQMLMRRIAHEELTPDQKRPIWNDRHKLLQSNPEALLVILDAIPAERGPDISDEIRQLAREWKPPRPEAALQLLQARYADEGLRAEAVGHLAKLTSDQFERYLPQLVQALKYEPYHDSALARLLMERALALPRIALSLFWLLKPDMETQGHGERYALMTECLLNSCGTTLRNELKTQEMIMDTLTNISESVREHTGQARRQVLHHQLDQLDNKLPDTFRLPIDPAVELKSIVIPQCGTFNSNAVPLRLVFENSDSAGGPLRCIMKTGDDLRQDAIVIQFVRIMDHLWRQAGLDLNMITFNIVPSERQAGLIEMVPNARTLREIHTAHGATGSFLDKGLYTWLKEQNPSVKEWQAARKRFTASCAGYCVATYILGVCDRHNDNLLVSTTGLLFHIDFGRFLNNFQRFGPINRDRVPFVLTSDMAYVINEGDKPTSNFQTFVDMCCKAYNIIRRHADLFINLMMLMLNAGIEELQTESDIQPMLTALRLDESDEDATAAFTKMIRSSLSNKFTKINFFFHNLGQMKSSKRSSQILSFVPEAVEMPKPQLRPRTCEIVGFLKRRAVDNSKYYIYRIQVERNDATVYYVYRRFSEFAEFNHKLARVSNNELPRFPAKIFVARSHTRQVTEKRMVALNEYLSGLMALPDTVKEHVLVINFLHHTKRDRHDQLALVQKSRRDSKAKMTGDKKFGEVQLTIKHDDRKQLLSVMVHHARNIQPIPGSSTADPYIKTYLLPERHRDTKRKTEVVSNTLNPTYNAKLEYPNMTADVLEAMELEVAVWSRNTRGQKVILGLTTISIADVTRLKAHAQWYTLQEYDDSDINALAASEA
eukprot:TRINITY_DN11651_c0_g1_i3.p1 TRINITY_DN11651_c0_g1~~TRINITY_DN11651_c0_g1_i3.p1  ORF type:complete len:1647 (+),score=509.93 TRINITY_DN11651_c0_g1_i3:2-4942(+)